MDDKQDARASKLKALLRENNIIKPVEVNIES